jgi:hypothetical protein
MSVEICLKVSCVGILALFFMAPGIASLIISSTDGNNACQGHDRTGLSLQDWTLAFGLADMALAATVVLAGLVALAFHQVNYATGCGLVVSALWGCFKFVWFLIGIVILSRSHGDCVAEGEDIGIITLFDLAWTLIALWIPCIVFVGLVKSD